MINGKPFWPNRQSNLKNFPNLILKSIKNALETRFHQKFSQTTMLMLYLILLHQVYSCYLFQLQIIEDNMNLFVVHMEFSNQSS